MKCGAQHEQCTPHFHASHTCTNLFTPCRRSNTLPVSRTHYTPVPHSRPLYAFMPSPVCSHPARLKPNCRRPVAHHPPPPSLPLLHPSPPSHLPLCAAILPDSNRIADGEWHMITVSTYSGGAPGFALLTSHTFRPTPTCKAASRVAIAASTQCDRSSQHHCVPPVHL